jgi:hypothetical protein
MLHKSVPRIMDSRPYFFVYLTQQKQWSFIARNEPYQTHLIPLEKWTLPGTTYRLCRVCYTQEEAVKQVQRAVSGLIGPMEGPDLYCVIPENAPESVIIVWKPSVPGSLEIQYQKSHTELVPDTISFAELKSRMLHLMGVETLDPEHTDILAPEDLKSHCVDF